MEIEWGFASPCPLRFILSRTATETAPVKNTFIHFDDASSAIPRSSSAPPDVQVGNARRRKETFDTDLPTPTVLLADFPGPSAAIEKERFVDEPQMQPELRHEEQLQPHSGSGGGNLPDEPQHQPAEVAERRLWADARSERERSDVAPPLRDMRTRPGGQVIRHQPKQQQQLQQRRPASQQPQHWLHVQQHVQQQHCRDLQTQDPHRAYLEWQQWVRGLQQQQQMHRLLQQQSASSSHPLRTAGGRVDRSQTTLTHEERHRKRRMYVQSMKATEGYKAFLRARQQRDPAALRVPPTPDASDDEIGKRPWEDLVAKWRIALTEWGPTPYQAQPSSADQVA
eukprot:CAMPEP_0117569566 /NCGR_PEP_ID=MMETSP0784-20121206/58727_1 /TAXON_ID=39447 /ORGANISM="" /LENGTH=338 /DNA_ID=CAMNT_0005367549 /DNA_START=62 /DNA_END=1078 /DNA_ORIENTATION=-